MPFTAKLWDACLGPGRSVSLQLKDEWAELLCFSWSTSFTVFFFFFDMWGVRSDVCVCVCIAVRVVRARLNRPCWVLKLISCSWSEWILTHLHQCFTTHSTFRFFPSFAGSRGIHFYICLDCFSYINVFFYFLWALFNLQFNHMVNMLFKNGVGIIIHFDRRVESVFQYSPVRISF